MFLVCEGRCEEHCTHSDSLRAWEGAVLTYARLQAAQRRLHQAAGGSEAVQDNAGTGGALWRCLTDQFGDVRVVKLLHTGSLSQELLNVSRGEDVRWKK